MILSKAKGMKLSFKNSRSRQMSYVVRMCLEQLAPSEQLKFRMIPTLQAVYELLLKKCKLEPLNGFDV